MEIFSLLASVVKSVLLRAMEAQGGEELQHLLVFDLGTRWEWVVSVTPRPRYSPGERTTGTIVQEAGWAPQPVWTQRLQEKSFVLPGIESGSPGRPVCSQTLY
jgi:hypothetical protein